MIGARALTCKLLSSVPVIHFKCADITMYGGTGRKVPCSNNYSHAFGWGTPTAAAVNLVSFISILACLSLVKSIQLYQFWFLVGNSGWHLIQLELVPPVSLKNHKIVWRLPTVIQEKKVTSALIYAPISVWYLYTHWFLQNTDILSSSTILVLIPHSISDLLICVFLADMAMHFTYMAWCTIYAWCSCINMLRWCSYILTVIS